MGMPKVNRQTICSRRWGAAAILILVVTLAATALFVHPAPLAAQSAAPPLRVVIKPLTPFVFLDENTQRGFSIDLWEEIAARMGRDFEYQRVETVGEQLEQVQQWKADIGITGISITEEREAVIDFSQPYFRAGLQVMTRAGSSDSFPTAFQVVESLVSSPIFWRSILALGVLIVLVGHLFWLLERRRNPEFPQGYLRGVWEGIWYTVVTLVTVGYGDRTAKTVPGRLVAISWMFLSLFLVSGFTASITTRLTVTQFQGIIQGEQDLPGKRLATVAGSTSAQYLDGRHLPYTGTETIEDAYALLEDERVDAIVYDSPVLQYHANTDGKGVVAVVGDIFNPQDYGIALPSGSLNRETVNRALLAITEDGTYSRIYARWFGGAAEGLP